ncbi:hypothetical protein ACFLXY_08890 [Chloroflexota bacterium]
MKRALLILFLVTVAVALLATPVMARGPNQNPNQGEGVNGNQNQHQNEGDNTNNQYQHQYGYRYQYREHGAYNQYHGTYGIYLNHKDYTNPEWPVITPEIFGLVKWSPGGFAFNAYNLPVGVEYALIVLDEIPDSYPPEWIYTVTVLGTGNVTDTKTYWGDTYLSIVGTTNIWDIPLVNDVQKIWLVPTNRLIGGTIIWTPAEFLFESEPIP